VSPLLGLRGFVFRGLTPCLLSSLSSMTCFIFLVLVFVFGSLFVVVVVLVAVVVAVAGCVEDDFR
jgi:hypothetical protein